MVNHPRRMRTCRAMAAPITTVCCQIVSPIAAVCLLTPFCRLRLLSNVVRGVLWGLRYESGNFCKHGHTRVFGHCRNDISHSQQGVRGRGESDRERRGGGGEGKREKERQTDRQIDRQTERERENSNSRTLILEDSSIRFMCVCVCV